eukprot:COSAG04_NODE_9782_length_833_cov_1.054496_1_plen_200_part_10
MSSGRSLAGSAATFELGPGAEHTNTGCSADVSATAAVLAALQRGQTDAIHPQFPPQLQAQFEAEGYARLGKLLSDAQLRAMRERLDALMLGDVAHEGMSFQLDLGGERGDGDDAPASAPTTVGLSRPCLSYRRVNDLELDPLFREWAERPLFGAITRHYYDQDVAIFRAFMMNKPQSAGTPLGWHQDVGEGWGITTLPTL